jgi:mRNA interferase MazF
MNNLNRFHKHDYFFKKGDVVYVDLGEGKSSEQGGIRPCIIVQNDIGNKYSPTTIVAPISSQIKYNRNGNLQPTHFVIENYQEAGLKSRSMILFEQLRVVSKERILDRFPKGHIDFEAFRNQIVVALGLDDDKEMPDAQ